MSEKSEHPYIETFTNGRFHFHQVKAEEVNIRDVAHGLSQTCRFAGQCRVFYSVAQHSVLVSQIVRGLIQILPSRWGIPEALLEDVYALALLHDGSEAYLPDMPRPMKHLLPDYVHLEATVQQAVDKRFHVAGLMGVPGCREVVDHADLLALTIEARVLMASTGGHWTTRVPDEELTAFAKVLGNPAAGYWTPLTAEGIFLAEAAKLPIIANWAEKDLQDAGFYAQNH